MSEAEQYPPDDARPEVRQDSNYIPSREDLPHDGILNKHLDAKEVIYFLKMMLMGYEQELDGTWKPAMFVSGYDDQGKEILQQEGPLMHPREIRMIISFLHGFLNSNTFLSRTKEDRINDIMWDVSKTLANIFFMLRKKVRPETMKMLRSSLEYPILMALNRSGDKITLDAATKIQQSIEKIDGSSKENGEGNSEGFNVWGFKK